MKKSKCLNCGSKKVLKIHENVTHSLQLNDTNEDVNIEHEFIVCERCGFTVENKEHIPKKYRNYFRNIKQFHNIEKLEKKINEISSEELSIILGE